MHPALENPVNLSTHVGYIVLPSFCHSKPSGDHKGRGVVAKFLHHGSERSRSLGNDSFTPTVNPLNRR
jgi:hypothetical protein